MAALRFKLRGLRAIWCETFQKFTRKKVNCWQFRSCLQTAVDINQTPPSFFSKDIQKYSAFLPLKIRRGIHEGEREMKERSHCNKNTVDICKISICTSLYLDTSVGAVSK